MADVLILESDPPLAFYDLERPSDVDLSWARLISVSDTSSALRLNGGETPSAAVTVDNGDGAMTSVLSDPPLRAAAIVRRDGEELFRGVLSRVRLGAITTLELQA